MLEKLNTPHRIIVIGSSCAGKTTLAKNLAALLNVHYIELDAIHWKKDWVEREDVEFRELLQTAIFENKTWVMDGNYSIARDITWKQATTIIWLNYSFPLVFWRALKRTVRRVFTQEELYSGNRESFRHSFLSRESILLWVLMSFWQRRKKYREIIELKAFPHIHFIEFRRPAEPARFLEKIKKRVHKI